MVGSGEEPSPEQHPWSEASTSPTGMICAGLWRRRPCADDRRLALNGRARCLLIELQDRYNGANTGELYLSTRDAAKALGSGLSQAPTAFRDLEDRGFIRPTRKGTFTKRAEARWPRAGG